MFMLKRVYLLQTQALLEGQKGRNEHTRGVPAGRRPSQAAPCTDWWLRSSLRDLSLTLHCNPATISSECLFTFTKTISYSYIIISHALH